MSHAQRMEAFWRAFESGDLDRVMNDMVTADVEFVMPGAPKLRGKEPVRRLWEAWLAAFPDMRHDTARALEQGDAYAAETRFTGTHTGVLRGPEGEVPPTGNTVKWESADIVRFEGGKIASWHVYHDQLPLLAQLGLLRGAPTGR